MGRKKIVIPWKDVNKWLEAGCSGVEIADSLGVSYDTLSRACKREQKADFAEYSRQKKQSGNRLLRLAQFKKAMGGDNSMLIWLGKNRLHQSDKPEELKDESNELLNQIREITERASSQFGDPQES
jgi:IS30 family transposase